MLTRDDSLMEMSKTNQALGKQLAFLLSRTEFDRTKETFLACYLCTVHGRQKHKLGQALCYSEWLTKVLKSRALNITLYKIDCTSASHTFEVHN